MKLDTVVQADIFDLCAGLPDHCVDMILCDLPYGTTACKWDEVIPFEPMWEAFRRLIKRQGAIVLTGSQPFTSKLICSNLKMFKYCWVWQKANGTNFVNAPYQPLKAHEDIAVFSQGAASWQPTGVMNYYPQKIAGKPYSHSRKSEGDFIRGGLDSPKTENNSGDRYPVSILQCNEERGLHPTQKPVLLFEYLIKTYTLPGNIVFDPCVGSGTTAIAARKVDRHFFCGDNSEEYVAIANKRLIETDPYQDQQRGSMVQRSLLRENV